ncbi:hypothetical protein GWI33_015877 [Rhynchophorus ferrugineus]|uniref:Uncharacterized protein n=1 Tax=Rhynchophorus ferrugineus TaxID=354439 RepID=A0A834M988_RHYFE|nr:hypothetical protein GWI33_015877 [Rhynchophorus ferrugineus]
MCSSIKADAGAENRNKIRSTKSSFDELFSMYLAHSVGQIRYSRRGNATGSSNELRRRKEADGKEKT